MNPQNDSKMDMLNWRNRFDERQLKEIKLDMTVYDTDEYRHGTDGHNARLIIAKMASVLDFFTTGTGYEIMTGIGDHPTLPVEKKGE